MLLSSISDFLILLSSKTFLIISLIESTWVMIVLMNWTDFSSGSKLRFINWAFNFMTVRGVLRSWEIVYEKESNSAFSSFNWLLRSWIWEDLVWDAFKITEVIHFADSISLIFQGIEVSFTYSFQTSKDVLGENLMISTPSLISETVPFSGFPAHFIFWFCSFLNQISISEVLLANTLMIIPQLNSELSSSRLLVLQKVLDMKIFSSKSCSLSLLHWMIFCMSEWLGTLPWVNISLLILIIIPSA